METPPTHSPSLSQAGKRTRTFAVQLFSVTLSDAFRNDDETSINTNFKTDSKLFDLQGLQVMTKGTRVYVWGCNIHMYCIYIICIYSCILADRYVCVNRIGCISEYYKLVVILKNFRGYDNCLNLYISLIIS